MQRRCSVLLASSFSDGVGEPYVTSVGLLIGKTAAGFPTCFLTLWDDVFFLSGVGGAEEPAARAELFNVSAREGVGRHPLAGRIGYRITGCLGTPLAVDSAAVPPYLGKLQLHNIGSGVVQPEPHRLPLP